MKTNSSDPFDPARYGGSTLSHIQAEELSEIIARGRIKGRSAKKPRTARVIMRIKGSNTPGELHQGTVKLSGCKACGSSNR